MKRLISVLLSAVLAAGLLTPALAATPSFSDVSDPELSARVDSLRMLGVVAGDTAGTFRPNSTLTRAEFCVMAVNAMGNAGQVALYSTRTIFPDVRSDHWARGYINLAAAGKTKIIAGRKLAFFPILRAGIGMLEGVLSMVPAAKVGHIGLYRDPETALPVEYYCKLPNDIANREVIVLDPMLATGGSAIDAITQIKARGVKNIKFMCIIAAPEGLRALQDAHPDVKIYCASLDDHLDEHKYIIPGLGDAGDRIFGTK